MDYYVKAVAKKLDPNKKINFLLAQPMPYPLLSHRPVSAVL